VGALGYYWFDFAHHGRDRTTSLRLLGARYYGPSPRRFWTQDPARQGTNWYAYVANDPVNVVDPTGLTGEGCGSDLPSARNAVRGACSIFESHRRRACAWACGVTGAAFNCMRSWCGNPQYRCAAPGHPGCCPRGGGATLGFSLCTEGSGAFVFCPASFAGGGLSGRTETVWHEVLHYCGRCSEQFHPEIWRMTDCLASCLD
jgi:RHS repeat-associated protein